MAILSRPRQTLAIILGASEWPSCPALFRQADKNGRPASGKHTAADVFKRSHRELRKLLVGSLGNKQQAEGVALLDLFDGGELDPPAVKREQILIEVKNFLEERLRTDRARYTDLYIFFLGHGHFEKKEERTYLIPGGGNSEDISGTGISFEFFNRLLNDCGAAGMRHFYFINACHADGFGSPTELQETNGFEVPGQNMTDGIPSRGVAGLFSCGANESEPTEFCNDGLTAFMAALIWVLRNHTDAKDGPWFTLQTLQSQIAERIRRRTPSAGPKYPDPICRVLRDHNGCNISSSSHPLTGKVDVFANPASRIRSMLLIAEDSKALARDQLEKTVQTVMLDNRRELENLLGKTLDMDECRQFVAHEAVFDLDSLKEAVATVCVSDLVIVDLTGYEPAVMMLLGLRSVVRRGVTVCVNFTNAPGKPLPFYLSDIAWIHVKTGNLLDELAFEEQLASRVLNSFTSFHKEPTRYADLPTYDAIRRMTDEAHQATVRNQLLVLCSYEMSDTRWEGLQRRLTRGLSGQRSRFEVARVLDSPFRRLNSLASFEAIRQAELCIIEWSDWKPNVFFELGVRLAANPRAALNLICDPGQDGNGIENQLKQSDCLINLFEPAKYNRDSSLNDNLRDAIPNYIQEVEQPARRSPGKGWGIYQLVWETVHVTQAVELQDVCHLLSESAHSYLIHPSSATARDSVYPEWHPLRELAPKVAAERLLAAWLYFRYKNSLKKERTDPRQDKTMVEIATNLMNLVSQYEMDFGEELLDELASFLKARIASKVWSTTIDDAKQLISMSMASASLVGVDRLRGGQALEQGNDGVARSHFQNALETHRTGVLEPLAAAFAAASPQSDVANELAPTLADAYGIRGGLLRRLNQLDEARDAYEQGRELEENYRLSNTYNRTNSLMLLIGDPKMNATTIANRANSLVRLVRELVKSPESEDKAWALADLGLFLLLGGSSANDAIEEAYRPLRATQDFPKKDSKRILGDLTRCEMLLRASSPSVADEISEVMKFLEEGI